MNANTLFVRALKKYGFENFVFEIVERVDSPAILDSREQHYLDHYQSYKSDNGYNVAVIAGNPTKGRKRRSEETRNGLAALKKQRQEIGHPWQGRQHREETKKMLSDTRKGQKPGENTYLARLATHRKPIVQADTSTGDVIRVWDCSAEVVVELGLCKGSLLTACRGGGFSRRDKRTLFENGVYAGYRWYYLNHNPPKPKINNGAGSPKRAINQIDEATGEVIKTWGCIADIIQELGVGRNGIKYACAGRRPSESKSGGFLPKTTHAGYRWEYAKN